MKTINKFSKYWWVVLLSGLLLIGIGVSVGNNNPCDNRSTALLHKNMATVGGTMTNVYMVSESLEKSMYTLPSIPNEAVICSGVISYDNTVSQLVYATWEQYPNYFYHLIEENEL